MGTKFLILLIAFLSTLLFAGGPRLSDLRGEGGFEGGFGNGSDAWLDYWFA